MQVEDVHAVIEAAGADRPAVLAINEGACLALVFAAANPGSLRALVLGAPVARLVRDAEGYDWAQTVEEREDCIGKLVANWGLDRPANPWIGMGGGDPESGAAMARFQRLAGGPGDALAVLRQATHTDVRGLLDSIQCPTLVLHRRGDDFVDLRHSRYIAERVPHAHYVELEGDGAVWAGDPEQPGREIESFLIGVQPSVPSERVLATVMFTDIVGSTELAAQPGDARWKELLRGHDAVLAAEAAKHHGRVVKSLGDGALMLFDGPSRAIGCAPAPWAASHVRLRGVRGAGGRTPACAVLWAPGVSRQVRGAVLRAGVSREVRGVVLRAGISRLAARGRSTPVCPRRRRES